MYKVFLEYAYTCQVDGIVVGATQIDILKEISSESKFLFILQDLGRREAIYKRLQKTAPITLLSAVQLFAQIIL